MNKSKWESKELDRRKQPPKINLANQVFKVLFVLKNQCFMNPLVLFKLRGGESKGITRGGHS